MNKKGREISERVKGNLVELQPFATKNEDAFRATEEIEEIDEIGNFRTLFFRDVGRVLFCPAFKKLVYKTQVHPLVKNPVVSDRMSHSSHLSYLAESAANALGLNQALARAIALGHDLGHPFFGHPGEVSLSKIGREVGTGNFHHSSQSLRIVDYIAGRDDLSKGVGLNLTWQVRNGILMHDGERDENDISPNREAGKDHMQRFIEWRKTQKTKVESRDYSNPDENIWVPATLEACLVRFLDTISYVGNDFEDAVRMGIVDRNEIPPYCRKTLGDTNRAIIDSLVKDLVIHSYGKDSIGLSPHVFHALIKMKQFNRERIYWKKDMVQRGEKTEDSRLDDNPEILSMVDLDQKMLRIFEEVRSGVDRVLSEGTFDEDTVAARFLNGMNGWYYTKTPDINQIAIDAIVDMTDRQVLELIK